MQASRKSCFSRKADGVAFVVDEKGSFVTGKETVAKAWPDVQLLLGNIGLANHVQLLTDIYYDSTWLFALRIDDIEQSLMRMYDKCSEVGCVSVNVAINKEILKLLTQEDKPDNIDVEFFLTS